MNHIKNEKKLDLPKHDEDGDDADDDDDDSDLSNDTPLAELIKQEASAKQQRSRTSTPKDISSTTEQPDELQTAESEQLNQSIDLDDGNEQSVADNKVDDSTDLLENQISEQESYVESTQKQPSNDFNIGKSTQLPEEKPSMIEISMPIDSFESDSNDEKSMENIKREIEALPELKDSNSSENSQDEKIGIHNAMAFKENANANANDNVESAAEKLNDNSAVGGGVDRTFDEKFDTETIDLVDTENEAENETERPADGVQAVGDANDKDDQVESIEIADESIDLTESKSDTISEQNKSSEYHELAHETVEIVEKPESIDGEKIEIMETEDCQTENGETTEHQAPEEQKQLERQEEQDQLQQQEQQQQQHQHKEEDNSSISIDLEQKQPDEKDADEENELNKPEQEEEEEPSVADSTAAEIVMEISSDDMQEKDDDQPSVEETPDDSKAEADSSQLDTDDCIEIKSDDQKPDPSSPLPSLEEKPEKGAEENAEASVKKEQSDQQVAADSKRKTPTPKPNERKVSTDDELFEDAKESLEVEVKPTPPPSKRITPAIACDTDDDSVIEVVKEEKVGVKRDYSRRKKDQSHSEKHNRSTDDTPAPSTDDGGSISSRLRLKNERDRSESPFIDDDTGEPLAKNKRRYSTTPLIDSPNSPASSSDDRDYRSWKKSILLLYNSLAGHRCASIFAKPITDEQAPNYSQLILQPMDLQSLKRNIDSGQIRNILDFQLYVMRMCYNAIFYNINDDVICERAKEMLTDALQQIAEFSVTWKKESEKASSASSSSSNVTKSARGRKSTRLMN